MTLGAPRSLTIDISLVYAQTSVIGKFVMSPPFPPLNWLRAFEASARHLSFTHAANELSLSQVAVSKQIKQLELHLNEPLFVRHARSLELTRVAEAYLPKVRDAFERLSDGTQEVFGGRHSKILTVRSAVAFSVKWLAPRLRDFRIRHPNIQLRFVSSVWNETVGNPEYDLDIRYGTGNWPGLQSDRLTWDTIAPLCSRTLLANGHLSEYRDLANHTLIHVLGYQEGWAKWLRAAGLPNLAKGRGNLQVDNSLLAFQLASHDCGVALARSSLGESEKRTTMLVRPFDLAVPIDEAFYLVSTSGVQPHPNAEAFRSWLLEVARNEAT